MTQEILNMLNKEYSGKTFIYVSKYGETEIICDKVIPSFETKFDKETESKIRVIIDQKVNKFIEESTKRVEGIKEKPKYMSTRTVLYIVSTKGVVYDYNECYLKH